jgi:hypothetical protein
VAPCLARTVLGVVGSQTAVSVSVYNLMPENPLNNGLFNTLAPASSTKPSRLMLFLEIIPVCSANYMKPLNTFCGQNILTLMQLVHAVSSTL